MASVTLSRVWLHDAGDLDDYIVIRARPVTGEASRPGDVRSYAAGRRRVITRAGQHEPVSIEAPNIDRGSYHWLLDRLGTPLLLRDPHGRRVWGTVLSLPWTEWPFPDGTLAALTIDLEPVTVSEVV